MRITSFEITIPVLNEQAELEANINKLLTFLSEENFSRYNFHVVIADNGSTDATSAIAERISKASSGRVTAIRLEKKGVGLALKTVWSSSQADIVGYMDLDLATDIGHIRDVIKAFENDDCDILYGSRLHKDSQVRGRSLLREMTSRVFNMLLMLYLGVKFSDGQCGFKFLKRARLSPLLSAGAASDSWFFSTELLAVAEWKGLKIKELPVKWTDSPDSRADIVSLALLYLRSMKRLKTLKPLNG